MNDTLATKKSKYIQRILAPQEEIKDIAARLISDLKELSGPKLQQTLQEFIWDAEIGPALRRLADGVGSKTEGRWESETNMTSAMKPRGADMTPEFETSKREYEMNLSEEMSSRVFGTHEPSIKGFQAYLNSLHESSQPTTYDEKKEVCKTVNYWKRHFSVHLVHDTSRCTLKAVTTRNGAGAFQLRATGIGQESLGAPGGSVFPLLRIESSTPFEGHKMLSRFNQTTSKELLQRLRESMSLGEIARALRRDTGYISRIASGDRNPGENVSIAIRQLAISKGLVDTPAASPTTESRRGETAQGIETQKTTATNSLRANTTLELEKSKREYEIKFADAMRACVFGTHEPSVDGLQVYLDGLHASLQPTTYDEKQAICRTVKYWRGSLDVDLLYGRKPCGLSAKSNGGRGLYRIHIHGVADPILLPDLPKLICRETLATNTCDTPKRR